MNLLVKKIGLVLLPALFFACEDPTELGADLNPNTGAVSTHYVEIPLTTSQVKTDSLYTSLRLLGNSGYFTPYIGRAQSPDFGAVQANLYANLALPANLPVIGTFTSLDSAKLELYWNNRNVYGQNLLPIQQYTVYQLTAPIAPTKTEMANDTIPVRHYDYYASQTREVGAQIGQLFLSIGEYANKLDTAAAIQQVGQRRISTLIEQGTAERLFAALRSNEQGVRDSQEAFANFFKGIAIVPDQNNTFLTTFDLVSLNAGLTLYYTQGTEQKSIRLPFVEPKPNITPYVFSSHPAYFAVEVDRSGTALTPETTAGHLQQFQPTDNRVYFQGISGLYPKLNFSDFARELEEQQDGIIIINRAFIEVDSVVDRTNGRQPLPASVEVYFVGENNRRFSASVPSQQGPFERALSTRRNTYNVGDATVNYFQADIVYNLEQFIRTGEDRYLQAVIYPADGAFYAPNSFVVRPEQVKLKVWYTKVKGSN